MRKLNEDGTLDGERVVAELTKEQYDGIMRNFECKDLAGLGKLERTLEIISFDEDTGKVTDIKRYKQCK